jgi:hypothetical protein
MPPIDDFSNSLLEGESACGGLGQMTQDTYGKPYLHTFLAFINS